MIRKLMPHICLIMTIVATTLFILTRFNPGILDLAYYTVCMYIFFASALITSIILIAQNRRG